MEPGTKSLPVMLWKTQLLDLVSEAPKAHCVECSGISTNHRFGTGNEADTDVVDLVGGSESDLSSHSIGNSNNGLELLDGGGSELGVSNNDFEPINANPNLQKLTQMIQVNLQIVDSLANDQVVDDQENKKEDGESSLPSYSNFCQSIPNGQGNKDNNLLGVDNNVQQRISTQAAPWHRPSIYYFNPFGPAFHGNLSRSSVKRLLTLDGHFLVRKRLEDGDDEFVLSVKFNGRVKNFLINFDDTSGLVYQGGKGAKGFEHLEDLVQDGLVTMYVEHKAGPYIDLLYDLTQNEQQQNIGGFSTKYLDSLSSPGGGQIKNKANAVKGGGGTFTADCIYEFFENPNKPGDNSGAGILKSTSGSRFGSQKQNSPSPVSSLSGSSLERVIRQPDLKSHSFKTHTFQQLSKCQICRNFLWGLSSQGLLCQHCDLILHEACIAKVQQECEPDLAKLPSVFGVSLTLLVKATAGSRPPFLLQKCIAEIDKRGLHVEGIYRISGPREATERIKNMLERDRNSADLSSADIHSMCSIVKQFLRQLPEPLISEDVFHTFLTSNNLQLSSSTNTTGEFNNAIPANITVDSVRRELKKLPPAHYITLKYLLQHLHRVADRSELNKMNPFNLSSIFAPSLLCPAQIRIETLQTGTILLELMITQVRNLFPK